MKKIETFIKVETTEEHISNLFADAFFGQSWFETIDYEEEDYEQANKELIEEGMKHICREDIWARILFNNKPIKLYDCEDDVWNTLTLDNIVKQNIDWEKLSEGDCYDNDAILQIAVYGEVIYG